MPRRFLLLHSRVGWIVACSAFFGALHLARAAIPAAQPDADALYAASDWFGLRARLEGASPPLYRAAIAAAFLRPDAERLLREIIRSAPNSSEARDAHRWLTHLFVDTGQYRKLATNLESHLRSFPKDADALSAQRTLGPLLEMPDQIVISSEASRVPHDGGLFIPVRVNGVEAQFFVDTGAGFSAVSESEAARLGLRFAKSMGSVNTSTTQTAAYRVAIAKELIIGGFCLRDVTFGVFPNDGDPWRNLAPGRRGLIGFPVQTVLRRMSWSRDGTFAVGRSGGEPRTAEPNLALFDDHPGVRVAIAEREVLFTLDTGAVNTDLYARFGQEFPGVMGTAKKTESEVRGIAGAEIHGAFELTELKIVVGGTPATLRPAIVLAQQINSPRFVGNLGFDVLKQHGTFFVDFETMRVEIAGFGDK